MRLELNPNEGDLGFQIAPMIDVVFVIMLFFMVMAGSVKTERALKMKLPGDSDQPNASSDVPDEVTVCIAENGQVSRNDDQIDTPESVQLAGLTNQMRLLA